MTDTLTKDELIKIINSLFTMKDKNIIILTNQNITDKKLYQSLSYYSKKWCLPIHLQAIRELHLDNNEFIYGYEILFNILQFSLIKILDLSNNNLDDKSAILLSKYLNNNTNANTNTNTNMCLSTLENLDISGNLIGCEGAKAIAESLKTHIYLNILDISENNIGSEGANYIGEMLKVNKSIKILDINENNINIYECNIFAEGISINKSLYSLDIGYNDNENIIYENENIIYENIKKVFNLILSSKSIMYLLCNFSNIDDLIVQYIANELKINNVITELSLTGNPISNEGAYLLFDALKNNPFTVLKTIILSGITGINNECLGSFAELIGNNEILQSVDMEATEIDNEGILELSKRSELKYNESIVVLKLGNEDIGEKISSILTRNTNLFWYPYLHKFELFNYRFHCMLMSTLLCNTYGSLNLILPKDIIIYIFTFFNRSNFLNY